MIKLLTDNENVEECKVIYSDSGDSFNVKGKLRGAMKSETITFENEEQAKLCVKIINYYLGLNDYIMAEHEGNIAVIRYNIEE